VTLDRREWRWLAVLTVAAFIVRLLYVAGEYAVTPDGVYYAWLGDALVSGDLAGGLSTYWSPLYPLLTGVAGRLVGNLEFGGRLVSAVLGSLLLVPAYLLIRHAFGRRTALLGTVLLVFEPQVARNASKVMTDIPFTFFFLLAVLAGGATLFGNRRGAAVGAGLAFGACYLTRPEGFFFPWLLAALMVGWAWIHAEGRKDLLLRVALLLGAFLLLAGPYLGYLRAQTGQFTISAKFASHVGQDMGTLRLIDGEMTFKDVIRAGRSLETAPREEPDEPRQESLVERESGLRWHIKKTANNINTMFDYVLPRVFFGVIPLLVGIGLARNDRTIEGLRWELYLLIMVGAVLAGYAVTIPIQRYFVPAVAIVIGWVARGLIEISDRWPTSRENGLHRFPRWTDRLVLPFLVLLLFVTLLSPLTAPIRWGGDDQPYEMRIAGEWIRDHGKPDPLVLSVSPVPTFYAGGEHYYAPDEALDVVLEYASRRDADYLVLSRYDDRGSRLRFLPYVVGKTPPPELELVFSSDKSPGAEVFVYEFHHAGRRTD